ncbi:MAG: T9SS type A sorting domain-containing protein, partial [Bacteroidetes bacterium]|nr:T9SS type A sorting domain-containing protein [Bacteroidota bacterium]
NYIMGGIIVDSLNGVQFNRLALFGINNVGQRTWTKKYGSNKFQYLDNNFISRWFYKQDNFLYNVCCVKDSNNKYLGVFMKFDLNGDTLWQKKFYDTVGVEPVPQRVTPSVDGGFLITGFWEDFNFNRRLLMIIKTDINGNELWRKKIGKTGNNVQDGKAIIQDTVTKKIVIVGYQYIGTATEDNFVICDSLGNKLSQLNYTNGSLGGWMYDVIQTKDKKFVAVGRALYPQMIGNTNLTRAFAVKFDLNSPSVPVWKTEHDRLDYGNTFLCLKELPNETLLIAGGIDTMIQHNLPLQAFNRITKMDKNGNVIWNRNYNYSTNTAVPNQMSVASLNLAANGDWLTAVQVANYPNPNPFFFVRYDSTGCDSTLNYCLSVGIEERKKIEDAISIYPNPIKSVINLNFSLVNLSNENISIKIFDVMGRVIKEEELSIEREKTNINANELDKGVYFLQIYNEDKFIAIKKIVKE